MKNIIQKLLEGIGIGLGIGIVIFVAILVQGYIEQKNMEKFYQREEVEEKLISPKGDLQPDIAFSDEKLMELLSGKWYGVTWDPKDETLYEHTWSAKSDGNYSIHFNFLNTNKGTYLEEEIGVWWVKEPFLHYKSTKYEDTYKILFYNEDYVVYQIVLMDKIPVTNGNIYIKTKLNAE